MLSPLDWLFLTLAIVLTVVLLALCFGDVDDD